MSAPRQQVNLYQPETASRRGLFGADTLVLATGAVVLLLLVISSMAAWRVDGLQRAVHNLQQQRQAQQQTMSALGSMLSVGANSTDIESRIHRLQGELQLREQALTLLRQGAIGRTSGFSATLTALARCPIPGLWLQRVAISGVTGSMSLAGDTEEPDDVPQYLRALAGERALSGLRFDRLVIERQPPRHGKLAKGAAATPHGAFSFSADGTPAADAQIAGAQAADAQVADAQVADAQAADAQVADTQAPDAQGTQP